MITSVEVYLWGSRIGILHQENMFSPVLFEYDKDFVKSGIEVSPFMMPLSSRLYSFPDLSDESFHGVPGMIADSLPDRFGNTVINKWLASTGRSPESFTALDRLCYTGIRGMGALEYFPATGPDFSGKEIDISEMSRFAAEILSEREGTVINEHDAHLAQLVEIGSSAGGARAKALIAWNESTGEVKSGQINAGDGFRYWLLKFGEISANGDHGLTDGKQYTQIEYAYYLMARDLDIKMQECRIYEKDGIKHFLTERFDRMNDQKIYMQSLAALIHSDFNNPGSCSYEMYAEYAKRLGITMSEVKEIYSRMVFAAVSMNCDDHVKNFSFLMDRNGNWSLSPAYDITFAYNPGNRWISGHQMTINGKRNDVTDSDLVECGKKMGLKSDYCKRVTEKTHAVVSDWMSYAERCGIKEERAREIARVLGA